MVMIEMTQDELDDLLREINRTTRHFPVPPEEFDPLTAHPDDLKLYGFPPEPNQSADPDLYDFWNEMVSPPLSYPKGDFDYAPALAQNIQSAGAAVSRRRHQSSRNWSGGYITPRDGRMFTDVLGSWIVPAVAAPAGSPPGAEFGSSTWIGFDGQRRYQDSTLPQIGTAQFLNLGGVPGSTTISWVQWWPGPPLTLPTLPVNPGDRMLAWLTVVSATDVILRIRRLGVVPGPFFPFLRSAPAPAEVSGATAEWVMERPARWPTDVLYELPDYTPVSFQGARALSARAPGLPYRVETLTGSRLIRMYRTAQNPHRAVTISSAQRLVPFNVNTSFVP
jgi:hypothetical protein